jgi:hypothetical protein
MYLNVIEVVWRLGILNLCDGILLVSEVFKLEGPFIPSQQEVAHFHISLA